MIRRVILASLSLLALMLVVGLHTSEAQQPSKELDKYLAETKEKLITEQQILLRRFNEFQQNVLQLKERLIRSPKEEDRRRAKILERVLQESRDSALSVRFQQLVDYLKNTKFTRITELENAKKDAEKLANELRKLIALFEQDDSKDLRERIEDLKKVIENIERNIQDTRVAQANTKLDRDTLERLQQAQARVTKDTKQIGKDLDRILGKDGKGGNGEGKVAKSEDKSGAKDGEKAGDSKGGDAKGGDGKGGDAKDADGSQGQAKGGDGKGSDSKDGDGKAGDAKGDGDGKGDGQPGDAKGGDGKGGEGDGQPGDAKGGDGKGGEGDAKGGEGGEASGSKGGEGGEGGEGGKGGEGGEGGEGGGKGGEGGEKAGDAKDADKDGKDGDKADKSDTKSGESGDQAKAKAGDKGDQGGSKDAGDSKGGEGGEGGGSAKGGESGGEPSGGGGGGGGEGGDDEEQDITHAKKKVQDAEGYQQSAGDKIAGGKKKEAVPDQGKAIKELEAAKKKLEDLLRQLREEELERLLAALQGRCEKMLAMQIRVWEGTKVLHQNIQGRADKKPTGIDQKESLRLSDDEKDIVLEATKAIEMLEAEGSAVAFPEVFKQVREDMKNVQRRLEIVDPGPVTIAIEEDIIATLKEMIEALKKAQKDLQDQKDSPPPPPGQQGPPPDQKLLDLIAELKMIKSMQIRVNNRTEAYGKQYQGEQAQEPEVRRELRQLADRQERIFEVTQRLARGDNK